jgi:DNA-binding transcriptional regulator YiaG
MLATLGSYDKDTCPQEGRNAHIQARVLHEACLKLGGERHLAEYLGVSVGLVHAWLKGRGIPSDEIFLKCLDLVEGPPDPG